jgi:hypothetical protein
MINLFNYIVYRYTERCEYEPKQHYKVPRHIAPLESSERRTISGFQAGHKRKISAQGRVKIVHSKMELDSHADTIVAGSNCIVMHYTGKECNVSPCTEQCEDIKNVPIVQAATACDDPETQA